MEFLRNIGETVNSAIDYIVEKNKKFTKSAKIRRLIKKESDSIIKAYITLGKHYYNDLRDVPDDEMRKICESIDVSKKEISKLREKLIQINVEENFWGYRDLVEEEFDFDKEGCDCSCMGDNEACSEDKEKLPAKPQEAPSESKRKPPKKDD